MKKCLIFLSFGFLVACHHKTSTIGTHNATQREDSIYTNVNVEPYPKGGIEKFYRTVGEKIKYPEGEKDDFSGGHVAMSWIVEKDGGITNFEKIRGSVGICEQIKKLVTSMPKWTPGLMNNKPVRTKYVYGMVICIGDQ